MVTISMYVNLGANGGSGTYPAGTLNNHVMVFSAGSNSSTIILQTYLIQSGSATISGNTFTIAKHTVNSSGSSYTQEYGTGTFKNNSVTFDFHQDIITNNVLVGSGEWTGTLTKE